MDERNEPTTGEIVATLRRGCLIVHQQAADRLESQEATIAELTARAESAEAREAAAIADLQMFRGKKCDGCFYAKKENRGSQAPCRDCQSPISNYGDAWKWRGLQPKDGRGK